jgi:SRSO17 transposase
LEQIRQAVEESLTPGVMVADAGYGVDGPFRTGVTEMGLEHVVGVQSSLSVWGPGTEPLLPLPRKHIGRSPSLLRRDKDHHPISVRELTSQLSAEVWRSVAWRQGTRHRLSSCFAALAGSSGASRLVAGRTTRGGMAPDGMA